MDPNLVRLGRAYNEAVSQLGGEEPPPPIDRDSSDGEEAAMDAAAAAGGQRSWDFVSPIRQFCYFPGFSKPLGGKHSSTTCLSCSYVSYNMSICSRLSNFVPCCSIYQGILAAACSLLSLVKSCCGGAQR